jgi:hypothetical protein
MSNTTVVEVETMLRLAASEPSRANRWRAWWRASVTTTSRPRSCRPWPQVRSRSAAGYLPSSLVLQRMDQLGWDTIWSLNTSTFPHRGGWPPDAAGSWPTSSAPP